MIKMPVQSAVTEQYPEAIFYPVEASGDGAVNFYSRLQTSPFKARQRAAAEPLAVAPTWRRSLVRLGAALGRLYDTTRYEGAFA